MFECYLNLPETEKLEQNLLNYDYIREQQQADNELLIYNDATPTIISTNVWMTMLTTLYVMLRTKTIP